MNILDAFVSLFNAVNLVACLSGVLVGTVVGVLPGIGPVSTMALLLPVSYHLTPLAGLIMLAGVYYGAMYGGSTTSILFRVPGEAASILTCVDGYALARKGRGGAALAIAAISSFVAGTIGLIGLQLFAPLLAKFAVFFGAPEFLMIGFAALFGLSNIVGGGAIKNFAVSLVGVAMATVGLDTLTGVIRFDFGNLELAGGFELAPVIMGLYGISEMIGLVINPGQIEQVATIRMKDIYPSRAELRKSFWPMIRSGPIGFFIGLLPGPAVVMGPFISYFMEKKISKTPEEFGNGSITAVASVEGANNAAAMGAMVPLLALGIPLAPSTAILLSGLMIHGVIPGPMMLTQHPEIFWGVIASMYLGNIILLMLNMPLVGIFARLVTIRPAILTPIITAVMMVGAYSLNGSLFDVVIMVVLGIIGYGMREIGIELMPLVVGLVLGRLIETSYIKTAYMYEGSLSWLISRPIPAVMAVICVAVIVCKLVLRKNKLVPPVEDV